MFSLHAMTIPELEIQAVTCSTSHYGFMKNGKKGCSAIDDVEFVHKL